MLRKFPKKMMEGGIYIPPSIIFLSFTSLSVSNYTIADDSTYDH